MKISPNSYHLETNTSIRIRGPVRLGMDNSPYSPSLWINPYQNNRSTIIYMPSLLDEVDKWCLPILGLTATGNLTTFSWNRTLLALTGPVIPIDVWAHVVVTYHTQSQLQLILNGTHSNNLDIMNYISSGQPNHLIVGSVVWRADCAGFDMIKGHYHGAIDDLRLYLRQLTDGEIRNLAHRP